MKDNIQFQSPSGFPSHLSRDRREHLVVTIDTEEPGAAYEQEELNNLLRDFELTTGAARDAYKFLRTHGGVK